MPWCSPSYPSIYKPLNEDRKELRLLTLLPPSHGREDGTIQCELATYSLLPPHPEKNGLPLPSYDALSYEWGPSTSNRREIQLQDEPYLIRENLWLALHRLRSSSRRRTLWIDALCINQHDDRERGHQVGLMSVIYSRARMVHVWLGPESENTLEAFDLLEIIWEASGKCRYTQLEQVVFKQLELSVEKNESSPQEDITKEKSDTQEKVATIHARIEERRALCWYDIDLMGHLMQEYAQAKDWDWNAWLAMEELLDLSYWHRIWIVQEFVLARRLQIYCGSHSISWKAFDGALSHVLRFKAHRFPDTHFVQTRFWSISHSAGRKVWDMRSRGRENKTLLSLLEAFQNSQCSDRRDKVYALLGLAKDVPSGAIEVDYAKAPFELAMEVVMFFRRRQPVGDLSYISSLMMETLDIVS